MQFASTISFAALAALVASAPTGATPFNLVAIRSGSEFQNSPITVQDSTLYVGATGGDSATLILNADGTLSDSTNNKWIKQADTQFFESSEKNDATKGFLIQDGYLYFGNTSTPFYACGVGHDEYTLTTECATDNLIALSVQASS